MQPVDRDQAHTSFLVTPVISSFNPTIGGQGTAVTITGTGFTGATAMKFNGMTATFNVTDASHIATTVPSGATTGTLSVTTPGGTATSSGTFTVFASHDHLLVLQAAARWNAGDNHGHTLWRSASGHSYSQIQRCACGGGLGLERYLTHGPGSNQRDHRPDHVTTETGVGTSATTFSQLRDHVVPRRQAEYLTAPLSFYRP